MTSSGLSLSLNNLGDRSRSENDIQAALAMPLPMQLQLLSLLASYTVAC